MLLDDVQRATLNLYLVHVKRRMPLGEKLFLNFLIKKGILGIFVQNLSRRASVNAYPDTLSLKNLVTSAFSWTDTPQGMRFWYGISVEWIRLLDSKGDYYTFDT